ncbi:hypothetical protein PybrP1_009489, partial [[Pythium] brassicae (nom. inval.)]
DLGVARFVLGVEVSQHLEQRMTTMKQSRYISDVAQRFGQHSARPTFNPCPSGDCPCVAQAPASDAER